MAVRDEVENLIRRGNIFYWRPRIPSSVYLVHIYNPAGVHRSYEYPRVEIGGSRSSDSLPFGFNGFFIQTHFLRE